MRYPHHDEPVPETALAGYLAEAERIVADVRIAASTAGGAIARVSADFEQLRWFELPGRLPARR